MPEQPEGAPNDGREWSQHYPPTQETKWVILALRQVQIPEKDRGQTQIGMQSWGPNEYQTREEAYHHLAWLNEHLPPGVLRFVVARRTYMQSVDGDMHEILREITGVT